jgi:crossover junction endodeoxyribonuclease RuvC
MLIAGIDPGVDGAIALLDPIECKLQIFRMPTFTRTKTKSKRYINTIELGQILREATGLSHAYAEEVHASPQMGTVSAFSFGSSYGAVKGALGALAVPYDEIPPTEWKKAMRAPKDKKESRARAHELMPSCVSMLKTPDCAEAAMIAMYGAMRAGHLFNKPITPA